MYTYARFAYTYTQPFLYALPGLNGTFGRTKPMT